MNGQTADTPDKQSCSNAGFVHRNPGNVCVQTGEEFDAEFLRDRGALRMMLDEKLSHQMRLRHNQNQEKLYERQNSYQDLWHNDLEQDGPEFVSAIGYGGVRDSSACPGKISKHQWEYHHNEEKPGGFPWDLSSDRVAFDLTSSPRYVVQPPGSNQMYDTGGKMKFLCSFGGRILPRPSDGKLRYVGGETRIMSITKNVKWEELVRKTSAVSNQSHTIKYQLPGEDLDALISVCSDEDLHHMIEEYHELERKGGPQRLRLFLVASGDADSPHSFDAKTPQQSDVDYQYVIAVNGMLDSPRKNSGELNLASHRSPFASIIDYGQDSPACIHVLDAKDSSPTSSNFGVQRISPDHNLKLLPVQGKAFNMTPTVSPILVRQMVPDNANLHFSIDRPYVDANDKVGMFSVDNVSLDKSCYPNSSSYRNNIHHGPSPFMPHHRRQLSDDQTGRTYCMHFHNRLPSGDVLPYSLHDQTDVSFNRNMLKDRAFSDPQLCEHFSGSEEVTMPLSPQKHRREKSPSLAMSDSSKESPMLSHNQIDEKHLVANYKDQFSLNVLADGLSHRVSKWMDITNAYSDRVGKQPERNIDLVLNEDHMEKNSASASSEQLRSIDPHPQDTKECNSTVHTIPLTDLETSAANVRDDPHSNESIKGASKLFIRNSRNDNDSKPPLSEEIFVQPISPGLYRHLDFPSQGSSDVDHKSVRSSSIRKSSISHEFERISSRTPSYDVPEMDSCHHVPLQPNDYHFDDKTEPAVVVEDITGCIPTDISLSSGIIPRIEEASSTSSFPSPKDSELGTIGQALQSGDDADDVLNEPINYAGMTELEASIYGLQIIKNADIEELRELGSGTFGTVFYGKWRGTDVAIKRIKKSLFSEESPEQERLAKDFWREARILSNLHHPNVVAFYGVAPDGPGGTMATVTEYMVDGSLRHVLQRKIKALDRRKKLMIALDAAVGMEYLHLKHIVHFDLKCENLLVNLRDPQRPICKVGDFGLSRIKRDTLVSGGVRGTLPWMAPELLDSNGNGVSEKVDVYSFGIAMWEVLTGEEPYANMHFGAIISGIVSNTLRPPIPQRCDSEWRKLMEECWSFDPATRPCFTEIRNRLLDMLKALQPKRNNLPNR